MTYANKSAIKFFVMKKCNTCNSEKPLYKFYKQSRNRDGRQNKCIECLLEERRSRYKIRKEILPKNKKRCSTCKEILDKKSFYKRKDGYLSSSCKKCTYKNNRKHHLKNKYNITEEEYNSLLISQEFTCKICNTDNFRKLVVDHDHSTGKVRGLLCDNCNSALGKFKDDTKILENAINYLKNHI